MSVGDESTLIVSTVEKAELMSAIGREIERVDRRSSSHGYTNWALWAAIGVLGWKAIELLGPEINFDVGVIYLALIIAIVTIRLPIKLMFREQAGSSFKTIESSGKAGLANVLLTGLVASLCLTIQMLRPGATGLGFWLPTIFAASPIIASMFVYLAPKIPMAEDLPRKGPGRIGVWVALLFFFALGVSSLVVLLPSLDWQNVERPSANVKVAILLVVVTILAVRLSRNMHIGERRTQFQRLETELTLSKIGVTEARERYENLMLGMNVSAAIRPWVEAVMLPLEEANAGLSEAKQLLVRFQQARASDTSVEESSPLDVAVTERFGALLDNANKQYLASGKAYTKLKHVSYAMFGERDISQSPISSENEHISESRRRFEETFKEVRAIASASSGERSD